MWFAGVHSEVGGGKKQSLTDVPLRWMQENAMANGLELDPNQIVCIDKGTYLSVEVSDHFAWNWFPLNPYPVWARLRGSRPYVRPIGGTPAECVHAFVSQKVEAMESNYDPPNQGLDTTDTCPGDSAGWECEN